MAQYLPDSKYVLKPSAAASLAAAMLLALPALPLLAQAKPSPAAPAEDELIFTNGDKLSGKLTRAVGDSVVFHSDIAGDITVPLEKIKEMHTQGNYAVLKHHVPVAESRHAQPGKIDVADSAVTVTPPATGAAETVQAKDVAYVIDEDTFKKELTHTPGLLHGWNGTANLGTGYNQATIHGGTIAAGIALIRQVPVLTFLPARNKTTLNFQENYGVLTTPGFIAGTTGDVQAKTSIMHADAERDEYLKKNLFVLGALSFDHNYAQSLDLQQIYGGGFGYTAINTPLQELDLKAEVHYEKQKFFGDVGNQNLIGSTFSDNYRLALPKKMVLTQTAAYIPAWNNTNAYSANGSIGLTAPLFNRFSLQLMAIDSFLNNPVSGYQKNSVTFTTGLAYTFR